MGMPTVHLLALVVTLLLSVQGVQHDRSQGRENPIRKVVTLLQDMQAKVTAEGKREEELHSKFMCYCKNNGNTLEVSIADSKARIESTSSEVRAASEKKKQTEADLQEHKASRAEAKAAMATAATLRAKEEKDYKQTASDANTNLSALSAAIAAIEKGMGAAFLQTPGANLLRSFAMEKAQMPDETRQELLAFLSGQTPSNSAGYITRSGEIVGILKQLRDSMGNDLNVATSDEDSSKQTHAALMTAKTNEVRTLSKQIELELTRIGNLEQKLANDNNDLEETEAALAADTKFKAQLEAGCEKKDGEWEAIKKVRADELLALAETIKVLNDDDALELFKKTLPSAGASSFLQVESTAKDNRARALAVLREGRASHRGILASQPTLDLIELALNGNKIGFAKVIAMIDTMVENLKREQGDDESKKAYCNDQIDSHEDKIKQQTQSIADSETAIADMEGAIAQLADEIKALEAGIAALDKAVADATSQRKEENTAYKELVSSDTTSKEVLLWAKNRLSKFYDPKLYKAPPARDLSEAETITESLGGVVPTEAPSGIAGTGIGAFVQKVAPPPPPETVGPYSKKAEESHGVIKMLDLLVGDLDKEMQEAGVLEEDSQKEYEVLMSQSAAKRAQDSGAVTQKNAEKAQTEESLEGENENKADTTKQHLHTAESLKNLHGECDWLIKYYDTRRGARTSEIESLGRAKAVLNGADYSFLQFFSIRH